MAAAALIDGVYSGDASPCPAVATRSGTARPGVAAEASAEDNRVTGWRRGGRRRRMGRRDMRPTRGEAGRLARTRRCHTPPPPPPLAAAVRLARSGAPSSSEVASGARGWARRCAAEQGARSRAAATPRTPGTCGSGTVARLSLGRFLSARAPLCCEEREESSGRPGLRNCCANEIAYAITLSRSRRSSARDETGEMERERCVRWRNRSA